MTSTVEANNGLSPHWVSVGSGNGLSYIWCHAITCTNAGLLSISLMGTNLNDIPIWILSFSLRKMQLKLSPAEMPAILSRRRWFNQMTETLVACGSGSAWLPEPARDRGSKQETLNDDFYHTTCCSAAIFSLQTVLWNLVLTLNLWIGLCPMKRSSGMWSFGDVSVTYRSRNALFRYRTSEVPVLNQKLR